MAGERDGYRERERETHRGESTARQQQSAGAPFSSKASCFSVTVRVESIPLFARAKNQRCAAIAQRLFPFFGRGIVVTTPPANPRRGKSQSGQTCQDRWTDGLTGFGVHGAGACM